MTTAHESADPTRSADVRNGLAQMIDAEVARLRAARDATFGAPDPADAAPERDTAPRRALTLGRWPDAASAIADKPDYALKELLDFHDEDFVRNAYRGLLKREPDPHGLIHYVHALRDGRMSKLEILGELHTSEEGRAAGTTVHGLGGRLALQSVRRIPLIGRLVAIVQYLVRLPEFARSQERLETALFHQQSDVRRRFNASLDAVEKGIEGSAHDFDDTIATVRGHVARRISAVETQFAVIDGRSTDRSAQLAAEIRSNERNSEFRDAAVAAAVTDLQASAALRDSVVEHALAAKADDRRVTELTDYFTQLLELRAERAHVDAALQKAGDALRSVQAALGAAIEQKAGRTEVDALDARIVAIPDLERQANATREMLATLERDVVTQRRAVAGQQRSLAALLDTFGRQGATPADVRTIVAERGHLLDAFYAAFEDRFRGTREDIKQRVSVYLPLVRDAGAGTRAAPIVDLGCGRGEWLELLRDQRLEARGIDSNRVMIAMCRERELEVVEDDAIEHLQAQRAGSVGAITAMHVIEHLPFARLIDLFDEALRVLKPGGIVVFETPNPENLLVGACTFYSDPTHQRPLPPEPMRFIAEARGFTDVRILRLNPYPAAAMVQGAAGELQDLINSLLYGPQDYAVVGVKG